MTDKIHFSRWALLVLALLGIAGLGVWSVDALTSASQPSAVSFGTGFTYQGFLRNDAGAPLNDTCDFTFRLYDAATSGSQIGGDDLIGGVTVADGLFTVVVNDADEFGTAAVDGGERYLDIAVQCSGDVSPEPLSPRQPLTPVPYARFAERFAGYENLIVVAKAGGDFASVTAAVDAIGVDSAYPAASTSNRYLIYVAPGVYENEHVQMKSFVDIEGAGRGATILAGDGGAAEIGPAAATLVGAGDAEVRHLTVTNSGAPGANWVIGAYTEGNTAFSHVTAWASDGESSRGMFAHNGGAPILRDVALLASNGSFSNAGLDISLASVLADGLFLRATGGTYAHGLIAGTASQPLKMENVTANAHQGTVETNGIRLLDSQLDLVSFDTSVSGDGDLVTGIFCSGLDSQLAARGISITGTNGGDVGSIRGILASDCDLILRDATVDVSAPGAVYGLDFSSNVTDTKTVDIDRLDIQAHSSANGASGIIMASELDSGATGRVNDVTIQVSGQLTTTGSFGLYHRSRGDFQYRDLAVELTGQGSYLYAVRVTRGGPSFRDLSVDAYANAAGTVVGVEFLNSLAGGTMHDAQIRAENSGESDAIGLKVGVPNREFDFRNIVARVAAAGGVWGYDFVGGSISATGIEAVVRGDADGAVIRGIRCQNASADIRNGLLTVSAATPAIVPISTEGLEGFNCELTLSGSQVRVEGDNGWRYGLYLSANNAPPPAHVRDSYLSGGTRALRVLGGVDLVVVNSQFDGGATSTSAPATTTCTAVSYGSGTSFNFDPGPTSPCP